VDEPVRRGGFAELLDAAPAAVAVLAADDPGGYDPAARDPAGRDTGGRALSVRLANPAASVLFPGVGPGSPLEDLDDDQSANRIGAAVRAALGGAAAVLPDVALVGGPVRVTVGPLPPAVAGELGLAAEPAVLVIAVASDSTGRAELEASHDRERRTSERVAHLQRSVVALASAMTEERVLQIVVATGRRLGASSCAVGFVERTDGRDVLRFRQFAGHLTPLADMFGDLDLDIDAPSCLAARTGEPFFLTAASEVRRLMDNEVTRRFLAATDEQSWAMLPLTVHGRALAVLRCGWTVPREFPEDERAALLLLAGQAAAAIDRARLVARQQQASAALEYSELRYRTLAESVALDVFAADRGGRFTTDMPHWRRLTGRATPTTGLAWLDDVHPDDRDRARSRWAESLRTGRPYEVEARVRAADGSERLVLVRAVPVIEDPSAEAVLEWVGTTEDVTEHRATARRAVTLQRVTAALAGALTVEQVVAVTTSLAREAVGASEATVTLVDATGTSLGWPAGPTGADGPPPADVQRVVAASEPVFRPGPSPTPARAVLPLATTRPAFGALSLTFADRQHFAPAQRDFLLALAGQCAQALERAQLYAREQSTAQILQRALLPDRLPTVDGIAVAARYQAAGGSDVGGDWYDVMELGSGRVAIVLGDVVGRGVRAASIMGQVRAAVRAYVAQDPAPAHVLDGLDLLFAAFASDELVTLFYAVVDVDGAVSYSTAGHLPPFVVLPDGRLDALGTATSPPLGVETLERPVATARLQPGAVLCVYSDGVVEHRTRSLDEGMHQLGVVLASSCGADGPAPDLEALADRVLAELVAGESADDDASLLLVRTGHAGAAARPPVHADSRRFAADPASAPAARRFLRQRCREWSIPRGVDTAELLVSELVTNAVVHAGTPLEVCVELRGPTLRVTVSDDDGRRPAPPATLGVPPGRMSTGGRGLAVVEALADRWGTVPDPAGPGKRVWFEVAVA
jgi:PAS domain S-box-containing protein